MLHILIRTTRVIRTRSAEKIAWFRSLQLPEFSQQTFEKHRTYIL